MHILVNFRYASVAKNVQKVFGALLQNIKKTLILFNILAKANEILYSRVSLR
jgi:hypothetical protein